MTLLSLHQLLIIMMCWTNGPGQEAAPSQAGGEDAVKTTIGLLFEGMRKGDSSMVKAAFAPDAFLQTIVTPPDGPTQVRTGALQTFLNAIGTPHTDVWDEQIQKSKPLEKSRGFQVDY